MTFWSLKEYLRGNGFGRFPAIPPVTNYSTFKIQELYVIYFLNLNH